jgi:hypothetical protein
MDCYCENNWTTENVCVYCKDSITILSETDHKSSKIKGKEKHEELDKRTDYYYLIQDNELQKSYQNFLNKSNIKLNQNDIHIVTDTMILQPNSVWCRKIIDMNKCIESAKYRNPNVKITDVRNIKW